MVLFLQSSLQLLLGVSFLLFLKNKIRVRLAFLYDEHRVL